MAELSFVGQPAVVLLCCVVVSVCLCIYTTRIFSPTLSLGNRTNEDPSFHHWGNSGIKHKRCLRYMYFLLFNWGLIFLNSASVSPLFSAAPDQLWQKSWKPDRPCPAGQKPGPKRQRQLLWPLCQGLPLTWERVSSEFGLNLQECLVCVSLSASVSVLFPLPYFFLTLDWLRCLELTNYLSLYERMRMDMMTWGSHLIEFDSLSMNLWMCDLGVIQSNERGLHCVRDTLHLCTYIPLHADFKFLIFCTAPPCCVASFLLSSCQVYCLSMSLWVTRARINTSLSCSVTVSGLR